MKNGMKAPLLMENDKEEECYFGPTATNTKVNSSMICLKAKESSFTIPALRMTGNSIKENTMGREHLLSLMKAVILVNSKTDASMDLEFSTTLLVMSTQDTTKKASGRVRASSLIS